MQTAGSVNELVAVVKEQLVPVIGSFVRQLQVSQLRIRKSTEQVENDLSRTILSINANSDRTTQSLTQAIDQIAQAVKNIDKEVVQTLASVSGYLNALLPVSIFAICMIAALIIERQSVQSEFRLIFMISSDCLAAAGFACLINFIIMTPFDSHNLILLAAFMVFVCLRWSVRKRVCITETCRKHGMLRKKTGTLPDNGNEYAENNMENDIKKIKIQTVA